MGSCIFVNTPPKAMVAVVLRVTAWHRIARSDVDRLYKSFMSYHSQSLEERLVGRPSEGGKSLL